MLDYSICVMQFILPVLNEAANGVQFAMGTLMCLLIVTQFARRSFQMYQTTKRIQLSRYINLLVREGMFYFIAYVHISTLLPVMKVHGTR